MTDPSKKEKLKGWKAYVGTDKSGKPLVETVSNFKIDIKNLADPVGYLREKLLSACEYTKVDRGYKWVITKEKLEEVLK